MTDKTVPHSKEAEEAVIGSVLYNPDVFHDCAAFLTSQDFYIHRNAWIWQAFVSLHAARTPVDILTVTERIDRAGKLAELGGSAYLTALVANVYDSNNAEHYARIVEGYSIRRRMITAANETAVLAYNEKIDVDDALNKAHETLQAVTPTSRENRLGLADRVLESFLIAQDSGEVPGIPTGLRPLDTMLGGWRNDDLVFLAARPGMGKTGLLLTAARAALKANKRVVFFSMEMGDVSVGQRLIAQQFDIDVFGIRRGRLEPDEQQRFNLGLDWLRGITEDKRLTVFEQTALTASQIHSQAKKLYARDMCDVVMVDYVQLMSGEGKNRAEEVSECSRGLKRITLDLHIPVISAAQLNREIEKRSNPKPVLSDLKESGSLEQDADVIVMIWNKDGEKVANVQIDPAYLTVSKHRNGPIGDLVDRAGTPLVRFVRKSTKFEDA